MLIGSAVPAGPGLDGIGETREIDVVRDVVDMDVVDVDVVDRDVDDREVVVVVVREVTEVVSVHTVSAGQTPPFSSTERSPVSCKSSTSSGY